MVEHYFLTHHYRLYGILFRKLNNSLCHRHQPTKAFIYFVPSAHSPSRSLAIVLHTTFRRLTLVSLHASGAARHPTAVRYSFYQHLSGTHVLILVQSFYSLFYAPCYITNTFTTRDYVAQKKHFCVIVRYNRLPEPIANITLRLHPRFIYFTCYKSFSWFLQNRRRKNLLVFILVPRYNYVFIVAAILRVYLYIIIYIDPMSPHVRRVS